MSVERGQQRRPAVDDPNPGVGMAVDAALMSLGKTESAFEVQVVDGKLGVVAAGEEAGCEGAHGAAHMDDDRVGASREQGGLSDEARTTVFGRSAVWLQVCPERAQCLGMLGDRPQLARYESSAAVDAVVQRAEGLRAAKALGVGFRPLAAGPPFFAPISRSRES